MIIIGENIHVIAKDVSVAIRERNSKVIQGLTKEQTQSGADYIDVNVGPMKKDTEETMKWLVTNVQEVTNLPLSIDTMNPVAMEAGLKFCKKGPSSIQHRGKPSPRRKCFPWQRNITLMWSFRS
jgi:cobalamin-dependent methionine synthase I